MIYSRFINSISAGRQPSLIREMTKILANASPEMIPLSGGFPNPQMFPFTQVTINVADGLPINLSGPGLQSALQYLPTNGHPTLLKQLKNLQQEVHSPDTKVWDNTDMVITSGSQDGLCKTFEMLMKPGRYLDIRYHQQLFNLTFFKLYIKVPVFWWRTLSILAPCLSLPHINQDTMSYSQMIRG